MHHASSNIAAVSYTHLDVYKRQPPPSSAPFSLPSPVPWSRFLFVPPPSVLHNFSFFFHPFVLFLNDRWMNAGRRDSAGNLTHNAKNCCNADSITAVKSHSLLLYLPTLALSKSGYGLKRYKMCIRDRVLPVLDFPV